jgi:NTE family protein
MSLDTIIHAGLERPARPLNALVLMGGGARTAYQVGVLRALASILRNQSSASSEFPFQILIGTSAGALNATFLASCATQGLPAFERLAEFWSELRSSDVYRLKVNRWARMSRILAALILARQTRMRGAILDNMPLVDTLHRAISLPGIDQALQSGVLEALAVTASSYSSGVHWTFCHSARDETGRGWHRPGRRAEFQPITIEHLMASSAIPFLFPATPLWVDGHSEFFGDGSMRQVSPLSPAMHLGAHRILVIGAGQPERSSLGGAQNIKTSARGPTLGSIAGHAMASVFHDTLRADVEQTQRVTETLRQLPSEMTSALSYRSVDVLAIQPSHSLDALAQSQTIELPEDTRHALGGFGVLRGGGGALASYLLFEPGFVQALIAMGENDAFARKKELMAFFNPDKSAAQQSR